MSDDLYTSLLATATTNCHSLKKTKKTPFTNSPNSLVVLIDLVILAVWSVRDMATAKWNPDEGRFTLETSLIKNKKSQI